MIPISITLLTTMPICIAGKINPGSWGNPEDGEYTQDSVTETPAAIPTYGLSNPRRRKYQSLLAANIGKMVILFDEEY